MGLIREKPNNDYTTYMPKRRFDQTSKEMLLQHIPQRTGYRIRTYDSDQTMGRTYIMFSRASGAVGYHGAGFVNLIFANTKACITEITTFYELQRKGRPSLEYMRN